MRDVKAEFEGGVQIGGERLNNLRFADDTVLLWNSKEELTDMIQLVRDKSAERELLLNVNKRDKDLGPWTATGRIQVPLRSMARRLRR